MKSSMHQSAKTPRLNRIKNKSNQILPTYGTGLQLSSSQNMLHPRQLQMNHKFKNNVGNINEVSVLHYHRTPNMHTENNTPDVNHFQNMRHQYQQQLIHKIQQPQTHLKLNTQQKYLANHNNLQRKLQKHNENLSDKFLSTAHKNHKSIESNNENNIISNKKMTKEMIKEADDTECNNAKSVNNKVSEYYPKMEVKSRKLQLNNEEENKVLNNNSNLNNLSSSPDVKAFENSNAATVVSNVSIEKEKNIEQEADSKNSQSDEVDFTDEKCMKNPRDKTPMCLINDLARFNKISFQYRLTSENGPAHCKRFTVTLKLGDEEYTAEGFKIKQAQHFAAKEAIEKTKYKHPTPKLSRHEGVSVVKSNITPTVELNALAMKLGQQTYYIFDPKQITLNENNFPQKDVLNTNFRLASKSLETNRAPQHHGQAIYQKRYPSKCQSPFLHIQKGPNPISNSEVSTYFPAAFPCKITLIVGTKEFVGVGKTIQQAKHNAAANALQVLKEQIHNEPIETYKEDNDNKSPISLVFEMGIKRNLPVDFKVMREEGPAHMRTFITACIVGDIITEGEGTGKKNSKKKAAQKMLEELKKLPPVESVALPLKRVKLKTLSKKIVSSQQTTNNTAEFKEETDQQCNKMKKLTSEADSFNPITKLLEWHQNKKEKEPVFKLISEFGKENSRRRQFIMEVSSNKITARGEGYSKKLAKRNAAQNFLIAINESGAVTNEVNSNECATNINNNQLTKGPEMFSQIDRNEAFNNLDLNTKTCKEQEKNTNTGSEAGSSYNAAVSKSPNIPPKSQNLHMKDQLLYLAKLLGFEVDFSDYPKGNHNEFLTIVMLSTNPPQICHGIGNNAKESQEDASRNALKILSEMGLNNVVKT